MEKRRYNGVELTDEEVETLRLLAVGKMNKEIAGELGLSRSAIDKRLSNGPQGIYTKIGVRDRLHARDWYRDNITSPPIIEAPRQAEAEADQAEPVPVLPNLHTDRHMQLRAAAILGTYLLLVFILFLPGRMKYQTSVIPLVFSHALISIPTLGALGGLVRLRHIADWRTQLACRSHFLLCLALLMWSLGGFIQGYGALLDLDRQYPWWSDMFYAVGGALYGFWACYFAYRVTQVYVSRQLLAIGLFSALYVILPDVLLPRNLTLSHPDDPEKLILDVFYPTIDAIVIVFLAHVVFHPTFARTHKRMQDSMMWILFGFAWLFIADLSYSVFTTFPYDHPLAYFQGNWTDLILATAFMCIGVGLQYIPLRDAWPTSETSTQANGSV